MIKEHTTEIIWLCETKEYFQILKQLQCYFVIIFET